MSERGQYTPGPQRGAGTERPGTKREEKWTAHPRPRTAPPAEKVWEALTDPAHLREWAPFEADGSLGTVGSTVKLTTVAAPKPQVSEATVRRADAPRRLSTTGETTDIAVGTRSLGWRHAPDAVDQHRSPLHRDGRCGVAHLFRRSGSPSERNLPLGAW